MLRTWKLNLRLPGGQNVGAYARIANALVEEIRRGRLEAGSVLPGTRELAEQLGVNRKTVIRAYDELVAQGWLMSSGTRGTFVSSALPSAARPAGRRLSAAERGEGPQFRKLRPVHAVPAVFAQAGMLCLDDGAPDTRLFPAEAFARAHRTGLSMAGRQARLGYGDPRGSHKLRDAVSKMLNLERGLATTAEDICLTRGSQMAIYLVARVMIQAGDAVVVEDLTYPAAREAFRSAGADIVSVRLDENGLDVQHLEQVCRRHRVRLVYLTPHHQFPTTVQLRPERRLRLMALADQFGFAVVEDDYDHEFHFGHRPLLPLASGAPAKTIHIGSMSKLLAPGLRLGYLVAPPKLVARVAAEVLLIDRQGDPATEFAVAELIEAGDLRRHARRALRTYVQRRDHFASLLRARLGERVDFKLPEGGLALWLTFDKVADLDRLEARAADLGLRWMPSRSFQSRPEASRGLRIGFASLDADEMALAVGRLRAALG